MSKINKRFIALLVVFTSIISFLPVGFSGQANAAAVSSAGTTIQVNITGNPKALTATTDTVTNKQTYTTENVENGFDITLEDVRAAEDLETAESELVNQALTDNQSVTGIVDQKVEIISINGTSCTTAQGKSTLAEIGIEISEAENILNASTKRVGKTIKGLPLGVNNIEYKIIITKQTVNYTPAVTDSTGKIITEEKANASAAVETSYANQQMTICHANGYVVNKISSMLFKAYVGQSTNFDEDTDEFINDDLRENNTTPFLYLTKAGADKNVPLRYTFDVPDSISTLKYVMTFGDSITGATVYKNGSEATEGTYEITGKSLTGSLESLGQSDLIVVKLNSSSSDTIEKAYAIEIRYNKLNSNEDFSLKEAGITKLDYNEDNSVLAYIGKKFTITNEDDILTYTGDIYIDKKASMISINPELIRSKDTVAYLVTNNYVDSSGATKVKKTVLKNGQQFIDFMASSTKNQLQVDVYEGKDGNITDSSKPLARYRLNVNLISLDSFILDLLFENSSSSGSSNETYLTQPGVETKPIDFSTSRRTYDLYSSDQTTVSFALNVDNDEYDGVRSSKNEYIKVWLADDKDSDNLKEAEASKENELDANKNYIRKTSLDINLSGAEKMVVQAYYDDFERNDDGSIKTGTDGTPVYTSYPIGDKYVFYLPNNIDNSDDSGNGETSINALLNYLKVKDATLEDSDGNQEFSSDVYDYTTTVEKDDTTAQITATAEDDNVKSIIATVEDTETSYDLVSGEASKITLDEDGKTTVNIVVTAQDGITTKTYSVVIENNKKSSNVTLKNVILNTGDYDFDSTEDTTKVHVSQNTTSIKVTPVPEDSNATVTVDGEKYTGSAITVSLKGSQETEIEIVVKSEDGTDSKTYTLKVYRTDSEDWDDDSDDSDDSDEDDQYYDEYNNCWVDTTKYEEWGTVKGKPVYFDKNNRQVKEAWISTGGKYYYLNSSGYRASGWKVDDADGKTYYLDPTTGEMRKSWMNLNNGWYYLGKNGVMQKGWQYISGKWYYFTPNGQMVINQSMYIDGKVYRFGQDGAMY